MLEREGISAEIIDLRTIAPCHDAAILASVRKTGRLVVADQGTLTGGFAGEIVARVTEQAFAALKAAPMRVTLPDMPDPDHPRAVQLLLSDARPHRCRRCAARSACRMIATIPGSASSPPTRLWTCRTRRSPGHSDVRRRCELLA